MMTEIVFSLVSNYGVAVILLSSFLSCLAVPIPTSFMMLAGGGFVASGDLVGWQVVAAAYAGAIAGDQTGFRIGRIGGHHFTARLSRQPARAIILQRAKRTVDRWGGTGVFFSTWLVAPLGPWVNLIAGATGLGWLRFTFWDALGEAVWVTFYVGLGYIFANHITFLAEILGNSVGLLAALTTTGVLGYLLFAILHEQQK